MAAAERERNKSFQGHVAKNRFALWLAGGTSELRLRAKAIANNHAVLEYGSFREQVVSGWGEIDSKSRILAVRVGSASRGAR